MNDLQNKFYKFVRNYIFSEGILDEVVIDENIDQSSHLPMFSSLNSDEIDEVRRTIKSELPLRPDRGNLIEEHGHERWFLSKKSHLNMQYWDRYKTYLLLDKNFPIKVINTMDDILDTLTDLLGDPERNIKYNRRGLIIGDVQSGKTANYTGLICKAVDSGYKVVVLLTGTIENLRQQTQKRIDEGFVGRNSDALIKQKEENIDIGAGKYDKNLHPVCLTSTCDDFKQKNASNLNFDLQNINGSVIFVVKKERKILERLNKWLKTFNQNGDKPIDNSLLVIDDESDYASVNTKDNNNPTKINALIRELLKSFTKSSYVGFTATPFANIFIDPDNYNDMVAEDLFPKDYIYSLSAPPGYIGARNIFHEGDVLSYMLVPINNNDNDSDSIRNILPLSHKVSTQINRIPEDMKDAIIAFVLANVIEDIDTKRNMTNTHRSMLINVSRFTAVQEQLYDLVNDYLKNIQKTCHVYCKDREEEALKNNLISRIKVVYERIYNNINFKWSQIQNSLYESSAGIVVRTINKDSDNNLNYDSYPNGLRIIAIGGNSLSRGLTLEGLVVSYFYRNSKMYDTLMQMGRWFGYKKGYKDLCRIWMSTESIDWYEYISKATDELREEIKRYEDSDLTPMDFGLRVRSDLTSLIVTARNKMKSTESRECLISLSGETIETPELLTDKVVNDNNYRIVQHMIDEIIRSGIPVYNDGKRVNKFGFKDVPASYVIDLLEMINISPKNEKFNTKTIINFIKDYKGNELKYWDIALASGTSEELDIGNGLKIRHTSGKASVENDGKIIKMRGSKRRLGTSNDGCFGLSDAKISNVKNRTGKENPAQKDYFRGIERNPLLTIYIVSLTEAIGSKTEDHLEIFDPNRIYVGFGIGIPSLADNETKYARYILNKVAIQNMFEGELDDSDDDGEE